MLRSLIFLLNFLKYQVIAPIFAFCVTIYPIDKIF